MFVSWIVQPPAMQVILLMALGVGGMLCAVIAAFTWRALRSGEIDLSDTGWVATLVWWRSASWIGLVATFGLTAGGVW